MYKISRIILSTAKIKHPPGKAFEPIQRMKKSESLMENFHASINTEFIKKGYLSKEKLSQIYKRIFPNIDIDFEKDFPSKGHIESKFSEEKEKFIVKGHLIGLYFRKIFGEQALEYTEKEAVMHETSHLIDYIVQPKFKAKIILPANLRPKSKNIWHFYKTHLYHKPNELNKISEKELIKQLNIDFKTFFKQLNYNSYEKIEILQNFRYRLKSEKSAFINGLVYGDKIRKFQKSKETEIRHQAENLTNEKHHFDAKINLIETLLKQELKQIRKKHSEKFKQIQTKKDSPH